MTIPVIDSLEDFIWEGVFCYAKGIQLVDPLFTVRSKELFDIVDPATKIGWSAKTILTNLSALEPKALIVIQRANVMGKRVELGFPNLTLESKPAEIGAAIMKHWQMKIDADKTAQGVEDTRICILVKGTGHTEYAYIEEELCVYAPDEIEWRWANKKSGNQLLGLHGIHKKTGRSIYSWYRSGGQLFETFYIDKNAYRFNVNLKRLPFSEVIGRLA
jgi:hypothetical protein